jgi:hypothetical protein
VFLINFCPLSFVFTFNLHITINLHIIQHQKSNCWRKYYDVQNEIDFWNWLFAAYNFVSVHSFLHTHTHTQTNKQTNKHTHTQTNKHTHTLIPRSFLFIKSLYYRPNASVTLRICALFSPRLYARVSVVSFNKQCLFPQTTLTFRSLKWKLSVLSAACNWYFKHYFNQFQEKEI